MPPVVLKVEADAPSLNLAPVQFRNWDEPGIAIRADKAAQHALNLRTVAESLRIGKADKHYADYLCRFADQLSPMATSEALQTDKPVPVPPTPPGTPEAA